MGKSRTNRNAVPAKHPGGRPSDYTEHIASVICAQLATGMSLRAVCRQEGMPDLSTVFLWMQKHAEFSAQYARAREQQAEALVEELTDISDDASLDPNDKRVRVDTRKWLASKILPKRYGDRVDSNVQLTGADGGPIQSTVTVEFVRAVAPGAVTPQIERAEQRQLPSGQ